VRLDPDLPETGAHRLDAQHVPAEPGRRS
jgi:hypothetical protein